MEAKHTKGEWKAQGNYIGLIDKNGNNIPVRITHVLGGEKVTPEEDEANAKLMAAAPDLLEVAKASLSMLEQTLSYRENNKLTAGNIFLTSTIEEINKAIKKATL